jgi:hypothetical protein
MSSKSAGGEHEPPTGAAGLFETTNRSDPRFCTELA